MGEDLSRAGIGGPTHPTGRRDLLAGPVQPPRSGTGGANRPSPRTPLENQDRGRCFAMSTVQQAPWGLLRAVGGRKVFGNPGSTEMPYTLRTPSARSNPQVAC